MAKKITRIIKKYYYTLKSMGKIRINGYPNLDRGSRISVVGDGMISLYAPLTLSYNSHLAAAGGKIEIAGNVMINRNCVFVSHGYIRIEEHCLFGPNVQIFDHDHRFDSTGIKEGYKTDPIIIEKGCWIGAGTIILRGTHIGEGCVIGAGTIVQGEIPAHSLVVSERQLVVKPLNGSHELYYNNQEQY